ncbi:LRIG3 protein, partial [Polyodon spathula]|nr:LRIG3 protein [Polyodon spathula]
MGHHLPLLLLLIMCKSLEAWNCTVSCNCTDYTSSCCGPQKTQHLPVIGHQNATELVLDSCGSFPMDNNTLQNFSSLKELTVKRTSLLYLDSHAFHGLPMLQTLNLTEVNLSNAAMHQNAFAGLPIRRLFLANNRLDQIQRGMFAGLMNLEHLDLSGNGLRSIEENAFANLVSLRFLNLNSNHFVTITPYWFGVMFRNNSFPVVSLIGNTLTCTNVEGTAVSLLKIVVSPTPKPTFITSQPVTFPTPQTPTINRSLWVLLWTAIVFICIICFIILFCILRVACRYLKQRLRNDVSFNRFVDTPNILTLPENPQPIPHIEERHGHVHWSRENGDGTVPRVAEHSDGSYPRHQQTVTELEGRTQL